MTPRFVHLHLHSEYSLADSTIRIGEMVKRCVQLGQPAVALTDVNNLFAAVKFYKAAEGAGLKPILGADIALADGNEAPSRMTLLCRDREGYLTLSRLLSRMWMEGHRNDGVALRPDWLREDNRGLFALAGRSSLAAQLASGGRHDLAEAWLVDWKEILGDRLHLELTRTSRKGEEAFNAFALHASSLRDIPVVASNDVRFLDESGYEAHEARVCISTGRVLDDPKRPREFSPQQYLRSSEEMEALFADVPDAIANAHALAMRCNVEMKLGEYALPAFPVPSEHTIESWLRNTAREGLARRLEKAPPSEGRTHEDYASRLETELDVIIKMGFPGYFLIVADFINWGKQQGIPVGPGRGSGAGSLVAWALGITDLDPLPYDLLFERFLNPERVSMPDFDIDFCMDRRDEVIDYVARKYGRDRVSQIITYGTMSAKAVVRDCGRVLGHGYGFVDSISKLIPLIPADPLSLEDVLGRSERAKKDPERSIGEFITRYNAEDDVRDLVDLALQLEDLTRNAGKHAGGVVIAPSPLSDFCPLFAEHDEGGRGRNPVTQFDKDDVEAVGLVKFDFLGLRTLTIIDWAVKAINVRRAKEGAEPLDITTLPLDDPKAYEVFARGDTVAVFQFESRGMRELLKRAQPDRFDDLIALVSLYRPGPMDLIPDFIERKHGRQEVQYPHPLLGPILAPTYGIVVYQEQVMQTAQILGGYSLGGADLLRRAMGKKKPEEMAKERVKFEAGAKEHHGIDPNVSGPIFDLLEKFAGYGFNKSHAAAYALVSYQTAWLKAHYPAEFMAAVLSSDMDNTDKVTGFLDEARTMGLDVLRPDVNESAYMFCATQPDTIRYGLGAVKGVGRGACETIVEARRAGPFKDLLDLAQRCDGGRLNRRVLEALAQAGALDALGRNRGSLMLQVPEVLRATDQLSKELAAGQASLFGGVDTAAPALRIDLPECDEWPIRRVLDAERDTLGHYLSGHPFDPYREDVHGLIGFHLGDLERIWAGRPDTGGRGSWRPEMETTVAGLVVGLRKKGDSQVFVQIEDGRGRLECAFFAETYAENASLIGRDRLLVVQGGLREDSFSGGFAMKAQRCWEFSQLCSRHAQRLSLRLDLREPGTLARVEALLSARRPGPTPLRLHLLLDGTHGMVDLDGASGVRVDAELVETLRATPGVRTVKLALARPWAH